MGGATLSEPPKDGEPLKIMGSCMLAHAATKEEVMEQIRKDVYAQGVWDLSKLQIYPVGDAWLRNLAGEVADCAA
jgi:hypothetical protein